MRTPAQRGRYGRWLVAAREAKGYETADKALSALAGAGITIGRSTYAEYESGSKVPSRNHLPLLEGFWGPVPEESGAADGDLAAAIRGQTAAINALVREIQLSRTAQIAATSAVFEILGVKDRPPYPADTPDDSEHEAPVAAGR